MIYRKMRIILWHGTSAGVSVSLHAQIGVSGDVAWNGDWEVRISNKIVEDSYIYSGDCAGAFRKFVEYAGPPINGIIRNVVVYDEHVYGRLLSECWGMRK